MTETNKEREERMREREERKREREKEFDEMMGKDIALSWLITILTFTSGILNMKYRIFTVGYYMFPLGIWIFYSFTNMIFFALSNDKKLERVLVKFLAILGIFTFFASISR